MPEPEIFLRDFFIVLNNVYNGYQLNDINISHHNVIPHNEYLYHILLIFKPINPEYDPYTFYNNISFASRIVNSKNGKAYMCELEKTRLNIAKNGNIYITLDGTATRI